MEVTQKTLARIFGVVMLIASVAFISVPLIVGGHPGESVSDQSPLFRLFAA